MEAHGVFGIFYAPVSDLIAAGLDLADLRSLQRTDVGMRRWAIACASRAQSLVVDDDGYTLLEQHAPTLALMGSLRTLVLHLHEAVTSTQHTLIVGLLSRSRRTLRRVCIVCCAAAAPSHTVPESAAASAAALLAALEMGQALGACEALESVDIDDFDVHARNAFAIAVSVRSQLRQTGGGPVDDDDDDDDAADERGSAATSRPSALRHFKWVARADGDVYVALHGAGVRLETTSFQCGGSDAPVAQLTDVALHPLRSLHLSLLGETPEDVVVVHAALHKLRPTLSTLAFDSPSSSRRALPVEHEHGIDFPPVLTRLFVRTKQSALFVRTAPGLRVLRITPVSRERMVTLLRSLRDPHSLRVLHLQAATGMTPEDLFAYAAFTPGVRRLRLDGIPVHVLALFAAKALASEQPAERPWPALMELTCVVSHPHTWAPHTRTFPDGFPDGVASLLEIWPRLRVLVVDGPGADYPLLSNQRHMCAARTDAFESAHTTCEYQMRHACMCSGAAEYGGPDDVGGADESSEPESAEGPVAPGSGVSAAPGVVRRTLRRLSVHGSLWNLTARAAIDRHLSGLVALHIGGVGVVVDHSLSYALELCGTRLVDLRLGGVLPAAFSCLKTLHALRHLTLSSYELESRRALVRQAPALQHLRIDALTAYAFNKLHVDAHRLSSLETLDTNGAGVDLPLPLRDAIIQLAKAIPAMKRGHTWRQWMRSPF